MGRAWGMKGKVGKTGGLSHILKIQCKTHEWAKLASDWPCYREGIVVGAVNFVCNLHAFSHLLCGPDLFSCSEPALKGNSFLS